MPHKEQETRLCKYPQRKLRPWIKIQVQKQPKNERQMPGLGKVLNTIAAI